MRPILFSASLLLMTASHAIASEGGSEGGSEGAKPSPLFVTMAPLDVPIVEGDRADGRLKVALVLEAGDASAASALDGRQPELREAALAAASEFARLHASPAAPVDARRLAGDVSTALRRVDATIVRVLLVEVAARRA